MGTIKVERHFGTWKNITLPYTAESDGFIYIYANPSSTSGGSAIVRVGEQAIGLVSPNGNGVANVVPIAVGASAVVLSSSGVTINSRFLPIIG